MSSRHERKHHATNITWEPDRRFLAKSAMFFVGVCFVIVIASTVSTSHIYLNWSIDRNTLILTCKVENLKFSVELIDPLNNIQGYCNPLPTPECYPNVPNITLNQNISTNITTFTLHANIDINRNGEWTCEHGTNTETATTYISISAANDKLKKISYAVCAQWCTIPFIIVSAVVKIVQWICNCAGGRYCNDETRWHIKICFLNTLVLILCISLVCILPYIIVKWKECQDMIIGIMIAVGMITAIILQPGLLCIKKRFKFKKSEELSVDNEKGNDLEFLNTESTTDTNNSARRNYKRKS